MYKNSSENSTRRRLDLVERHGPLVHVARAARLRSSGGLVSIRAFAGYDMNLLAFISIKPLFSSNKTWPKQVFSRMFTYTVRIA
jgi:hypothetical protein